MTAMMTKADDAIAELVSAKAAHTVRHVSIAALRPRLLTERMPVAGDVVRENPVGATG